MKNIAIALTIFTLIACGKKDENKSGGSTTTALTSTTFNALDKITGLCVTRSVDGVIHFTRGYILIGGKQYTASNPDAVNTAINLALQNKVITYRQSTDVRFSAKITAQAVSGMMQQYPDQGYVSPTSPQQQQCNSTVLNLQNVVIKKQL